MHVTHYLSQWLQNRSLIHHRIRALSFIKAVHSLLCGASLSLTHLGRRRQGDALVKHQIKAVDRLLSNKHLHRERDGIYREMAASLLAGTRRPTLIVDWADFEMRRDWLMLKAAVPVEGRAITVFEMVFPFKQYNSPGAHRKFLGALQRILPKQCKPIIVTDAGFRGPWLRGVQALGWDFVGRIRNGIKFFNEDTGRWCLTTSLYRIATTNIRYLGQVLLPKRHNYNYGLYIVRAHILRKGRPPRKRPRKKHQHNQRQYVLPQLEPTAWTGNFKPIPSASAPCFHSFLSDSNFSTNNSSYRLPNSSTTPSSASNACSATLPRCRISWGSLSWRLQQTGAGTSGLRFSCFARQPLVAASFLLALG